jgi:hypothetical protein
MSDSIIWILFLFVFLIIIGLYISEFTPLDLDKKKDILNLQYVTENFTPLLSTTNEQTEGASELYDWPLSENIPPDKPPSCSKPPPPPPRCTVPPPPPPRCNAPPPPPPSCQSPCDIEKKPVNCVTCDITVNKDIDKYVLKSSVPACPDMSEFITKNMMNANPDLSDYILKSEIKPCDKVDISQYILKSEIPACPTCPICPECPICPICPPQKKCKEIHEYNITEHPDIHKYIKKDDIHREEEKIPIIYNNCLFEEEKQQNRDYIKSMFDKYKKNDVTGYYVGDSLFAGV